MSSLFLALTLLVYLVLPEMRDIQDKATMSVTASFMVAFFFNGNQQLSFSFLHDDAVCLAVGECYKGSAGNRRVVKVD